MHFLLQHIIFYRIGVTSGESGNKGRKLWLEHSDPQLRQYQNSEIHFCV
jgi:hypothetical protein